MFNKIVRNWDKLVTLVVVCIAAAAAFFSWQAAEWYRNPRPLICLETGAYYSLAEKGNYTVGYNSEYSPQKGVLNNVYTWNNLTLSFYNAGRLPAKSAWLQISIFTNESPNSPFPFKIFEIITPSDGFYYNKSKESFVRLLTKSPFSYGYWYNEYNTLDFPPLIGEDGKIHQPNLSFRLGTLYPEREVDILISLFATQQNASATLDISVSFVGKSVEETTTKHWQIPLISKFP